MNVELWVLIDRVYSFSYKKFPVNQKERIFKIIIHWHVCRIGGFQDKSTRILTSSKAEPHHLFLIPVLPLLLPSMHRKKEANFILSP